MKRLPIALAALILLRADMFQDASNARQPEAVNNLTKTGGSYYAPAYGSCTWDAASDVGACVNAAIAAAALGGGGTVTIPPGTYGVSVPISTGADNIGIACNAPAGTRATSAPFTAPAVAEVGGCELKWIGAAGGKILSLVAPSDARSLVGARIDNIKFNGNAGQAGTGLYLRGVHSGRFDGLKFVGGFNAGTVIDLDVSPGDHLTGIGGTQWNHFYDTRIYNWGYTSNGIKLGFYQSANPGSGGQNASLNTFDNLHVHTGNGATGKGIWCWGCDNNTFKTAYISTGTGSVGVDLDIYTDNGHWFAAQGNLFDHVAFGFPGGTAISRGQTTYPTCTAFSFPNFGNCAWGNEFRRLDGSNGTPPPTAEPGAFVKYNFDYGVQVNSGSWLAGDGQRAAQTIMANYGALHSCGNDSRIYGVGVGSHYCFTNAAAQLYSNASTVVGEQDHFTVGLYGAAGAEDMRWNRPLGTGSYAFADAPVKPATATVATLPACNAARKHGVMAISDQSGVPTYRGALTGGGAIAVLAFCNGTSWEAH